MFQDVAQQKLTLTSWDSPGWKTGTRGHRSYRGPVIVTFEKSVQRPPIQTGWAVLILSPSCTAAQPSRSLF